MCLLLEVCVHILAKVAVSEVVERELSVSSQTLGKSFRQGARWQSGESTRSAPADVARAPIPASPPYVG